MNNPQPHSEELLPCPWCEKNGAIRYMTNIPYAYTAYMECCNCQVRGQGGSMRIVREETIRFFQPKDFEEMELNINKDLREFVLELIACAAEEKLARHVRQQPLEISIGILYGNKQVEFYEKL